MLLEHPIRGHPVDTRTGARRRRRPRRGGRRGGGEPGRRRRAVGGRRRRHGAGRLGRRPDLARPPHRPARLRPAARAGAAHGPDPGRRAGGRPGPARPLAPAGRVHLLHPDARPHRPHHLGLRGGPPRRGARRRSGTLTVDLPGMLLAVAGHGCAWSWSSSPASARPARGCATSRGTCCTSTPTSASASPCRTSCGPARSSSPPPPPPSTGGRCGPRPPRAVLVWRVGLPLCRTLRHGLRVTSVVRERPTTSSSVYLTGRGLHRLPVTAGQFLIWRFLTGPGWTRAHPYSLSAAPDGRSLRITVKALGDGSAPRPQPAPRDPRARRGPVRPAHRAAPHPPEGRVHRRGRRHHAAARARRGAALRPRRRGAAAARDPRGRCSPASSTSSPANAACELLWLPGRRRSPDSWLGRGRARPTTSPCCAAGSPTSPSATSTSAARRPGPPPSARTLAAAGLPAARLHVENFGW